MRFQDGFFSVSLIVIVVRFFLSAEGEEVVLLPAAAMGPVVFGILWFEGVVSVAVLSSEKCLSSIGRSGTIEAGAGVVDFFLYPFV